MMPVKDPQTRIKPLAYTATTQTGTCFLREMAAAHDRCSYKFETVSLLKRLCDGGK